VTMDDVMMMMMMTMKRWHQKQKEEAPLWYPIDAHADKTTSEKKANYVDSQRAMRMSQYNKMVVFPCPPVNPACAVCVVPQGTRNSKSESAVVVR
jgi:hypothetical protein